MAKKLRVDFAQQPNMTMDGMKKILQDRYNLSGLPKMKLYLAMVMAKGSTSQAHDEEVRKIRLYAQMILKTNPGSYTLIHSELGQTSNKPTFNRMFVALDACVKGFVAGCRPVLGLDGCHLKGQYGGTLLTAIGLDGNLQFFPVAWAIVEAECHSSWILECIKQALGIEYVNKSFTIISDRQKVILCKTVLLLCICLSTVLLLCICFSIFPIPL